MRRNKLATLALLPALALGLQGCGGGDGGGTGASKAASDQAKMRRFAQCMRDNGVDMQDPKDGRVEIRASARPSAGKGPMRADPNVEAAQKKCAHLMPNGGKPQKPSAAELAKMRAYSKCMRDHGITEFPDPNPDGGMQLKAGPGTGIDPQSQTFKDADKACQKYQPDGGKGARFSSGGGK
ncbi:hypothetical protein [Actinomadura montaniterrae]|uniref:Uncharacterized protein n=1 Tax=Actinomadura montaniterrae TaxID=1803903 RepID=A0A6L3VHX7_9ACTN|nr:hypothetical protein [Actinomadura montaniterrae]KAB2369536.1 hypothetical protein F9B16_37000 [Actinomadura montaniterrae]